MATDYSSQITALETALANGTLTVSHKGRTTTYKSTQDLINALNYFKKQSSPGLRFKISKLTTSSRS